MTADKDTAPPRRYNPGMLDRYFAVGKGTFCSLHYIAGRVDAGTDGLESLDDDQLWELNARLGEAARALRNVEPGDLPGKGAVSLLDVKREIAHRMLCACAFCERRCAADRTAGEKGWCGVSAESRVSSDFLHMGEEPELVPSHTIFFSGCTFACAYCQNWDIATHPSSGRPADARELAASIEDCLQQGSRNVNFVGGDPTPDLHVVLDTLALLGERGAFLPAVWNSNTYASSETMSLLCDVVDVHLADFRYGNDDCAKELSEVDRYVEVVTRNLARAFDESEVMIRHLVLPGHLECCTRPVMDWTAENLPGAYFNLMFQYRPEYRAGLFPGMDRRLTAEERKEALAMAAEYCMLIG